MVSEHEVDPFIENIAGELRRPVRFDSTFESNVMAAIEPDGVPLVAGRKSTPWLLRPRTLYVSPLAGLASAAAIVGIVTLSVLNTRTTVGTASDAIVQTPPTTPLVPVGNTPDATVMAYATPFTYVHPGARSVFVVGSFNDWDATATPLEQMSDSVWTANIMLAPGRYEYQLVVDGKWVADPGAQRSAESDFGGTNSVVIVSQVPR